MTTDPKPRDFPSRIHEADLPGTVNLDPKDFKFLLLESTAPLPAGPFRRSFVAVAPPPVNQASIRTSFSMRDQDILDAATGNNILEQARAAFQAHLTRECCATIWMAISDNQDDVW